MTAAIIDETLGGINYILKRYGIINHGPSFTVHLEVRSLGPGALQADGVCCNQLLTCSATPLVLPPPPCLAANTNAASVSCCAWCAVASCRRDDDLLVHTRTEPSADVSGLGADGGRWTTRRRCPQAATSCASPRWSRLTAARPGCARRCCRTRAGRRTQPARRCLSYRATAWRPPRPRAPSLPGVRATQAASVRRREQARQRPSAS
jgi:hypothetical protein